MAQDGPEQVCVSIGLMGTASAILGAKKVPKMMSEKAALRARRVKARISRFPFIT